jgi:hypothetical protein
MLEQELGSHDDGSMARHRAHDVHRHIYDDDDSDHPPLFTRVSQNVATAAILLRTMPEPSTPKGQHAHEELRALLDYVALQ